MTTYNQTGVTFNEADMTFNGYAIVDTVSVLVNGDVAAHDDMAAGSLSAHVSTGDGNGTLDATFNDYVPDLGDNIALYRDTTQLFDGDVTAIDVDEFRGGHTFAGVTAGDAGHSGALPTTAPWNVSDTPNLTTTFPYEKLSSQTRVVEGVEETTYELTLSKDGLWKNMNVQVTSANHGLVAQTFTIVDATIDFPTPDLPRYTLLLGDPVVQLVDVIVSQAEGATVAQVINSPANVVIDEDGLTVTDGAITVINPEGTVVIDGSGDMFRIIATGTIQTDSFSNPGSNTATINLVTGLDYVPAFAGFLASESGSAVRTTPNIQMGGGSEAHVDWQWELWINGQSGGVTTLKAAVRSSVVGGTTAGYTFRFYIYEQAAI